MRINSFLSLFLIVLIYGCQDISPVDVPERLIAQKQMEDIMYESIMINAARGYKVSMLKQVGVKPETYVFEKFEIDSAIYAQNLIYYTADIEKYKEMNTRVLQRINTLHSKNDSIESAQKKIKDSLRDKRSKELRNERDEEDSLKFKSGLGIPVKLKDSVARRFRSPQEDKESI